MLLLLLITTGPLSAMPGGAAAPPGCPDPTSLSFCPAAGKATMPVLFIQRRREPRTRTDADANPRTGPKLMLLLHCDDAALTTHDANPQLSDPF